MVGLIKLSLVTAFWTGNRFNLLAIVSLQGCGKHLVDRADHQTSASIRLAWKSNTGSKSAIAASIPVSSIFVWIDPLNLESQIADERRFVCFL